jgi:hypothetical protein
MTLFSSDQFYKRQLFIYFAASDSSDPPTDENDGIPMDNHDGSKTTEKPDGSNPTEKLDRSKSSDKQVQSKSMDKHDTTSDGQEKFSCSLCITDGLKDGLV